MTIDRSQAKLPHAPRLISNLFDECHSMGQRPLVEFIYSVNDQIGEVRVIPKLCGWNRIWTLPGHDPT